MVGPRVAVWGGLALVAVLYFVDVRVLFVSPQLAEPGQESDAAQVPTPEEPGWPHLRGPHYNALSDETDLADSWLEQGPLVLWTQEIGRGYSGFVAVGNRVYTQRQTFTEQSVLCLDADTGRKVWEYGYGWPYEPAGLYPGPRATPTYSSGRIYFADPDGLVGCLRAADGRLVWSVNVNEKFQGRGHDFGYACSPLVEDGKVILPVGGPEASVVALDARDGSTVWASGSEPASYCSALPITFRGHRQVVAFLKNTLAGFDLQTGRMLWEQWYSRGYDEHAAMPLYDEPFLMTMLPFRAGSDFYRIEASEAANGGQTLARVRHGKELSNDTASSVLVEGLVYGFDIRDLQTNRHRPSRGEFKCLEFRTGKIRWTSDRPGHATVLAADGKLFLFNDKGELILARANPERYEELGRAEVFRGEICWTAPALHRGRLFLRSPTRAACLYVGRPERLSQDQLAQARPVSEIPKARAFDLGWLLGAEREYPYDAPDLRELGRWYGFSLGVFLMATLLAAIAWGLLWLFARGERRSPIPGRAGWFVFWTAALVLGFWGTPLVNRLWDGFVLTWPVSLFVGQQLALTAVLRTRREPGKTAGAWRTGLAVVFWLLICLGYYDLCRRLTLGIAWVFLIGFLPSWPLAIPAARQSLHEGRPLRRLLWTLSAFSLYFWASTAFVFWRAVIGGQ